MAVDDRACRVCLVHSVHAQLSETRRVQVRHRVPGTDRASCRTDSKGKRHVLDQLRRAASSISLHIAEAAGRTGQADAARTYAIARGSAMECAAVLDALLLLKVIDASTKQRGDELLERIVGMLTRLCR
ncbi:MAG TPA: four helix bundle protein [Myxococcales bacterium]